MRDSTADTVTLLDFFATMAITWLHNLLASNFCVVLRLWPEYAGVPVLHWKLLLQLHQVLDHSQLHHTTFVSYVPLRVLAVI